jgi:hypothetical protein
MLMWRCDPQMHHWSGRDIAQAAWGLAKLGARPNTAWKNVRPTGSNVYAMLLAGVQDGLA